MKLTSNSWTNGDRIPARYAAGRPDGDGVTFSENLNPHLAWTDLPSRGDDVNQPGREVPADLPRVDFFHWVMVDMPPVPSEIAEGEYSRGFTARGKPGPQTLRGARHGLNDYTGWFAGDADMAGQYFGYDGPFPPFNDSLVHHYVFTLYAVSVARLPVEGAFTGAQVRAALAAHMLGEATFSGTYTLNRRLI
jgi:Raf kinase inhibitor-like YbhB/YbcL family protein